MSDLFFEKPILISPYETPIRQWELDPSGQPTQLVAETRRRAEFITSVQKPRKQKGAAKQDSLFFDEGLWLSTQEQSYGLTDLSGFNELGSWRFQRLDLEAWIAKRKDQAAAKQK